MPRAALQNSVVSGGSHSAGISPRRCQRKIQVRRFQHFFPNALRSQHLAAPSDIRAAMLTIWQGVAAVDPADGGSVQTYVGQGPCFGFRCVVA